MIAPDQDALREYIDAIATAWAVPGGVVVVTDQQGEVFTHAFGFADVERVIRATPEHLFEIGSISKLFTAAVLLHLVDEGMLRLDQPVGEILEWLPPVLSPMRFDHLLQHTAGLVSGVDDVPDQVAQVAGFIGEVSTATPGTWHHYSNLGFILCGLAIERVSGRSLGELVRQLIFEPLGLTHSIPTVTNDDYEHVARGYRAILDDAPLLPGDAQRVADWLEVDGADGSIAMTAGDLAIFARMLLIAGSGLPNPSVIERMMTILAPSGEECISITGLDPVTSSRYGLGVNVEETGGRTVLSHGGGMVGYASFLLADLDEGIGVAVLTNANGTGPIAEVIARVVAGVVISDLDVLELDPEAWAESATESGVTVDARPRQIDARMLGTFTALSSDGSADVLRVTVHHDDPTRMYIENDGVRHPLLWLWGDAVGTRHPSLRAFPLGFDGENWLWGSRIYRAIPKTAVVSRHSPWVGHYRTYSPWFPNFRVIEREGLLLAISAPAVESFGDEVELVEVAPGVFRVGVDPRRPERLIFGPIVDGVAAWVDRDGCRYSRSFLD